MSNLPLKAVRSLREQGLSATADRVKGVFRRRWRDHLDRAHASRIINELTAFKGQTPDELVEFAWTATKGYLRPKQVRWELTEFARYAADHLRTAQRVVEVGTARGGTLFMLTRLASPNAVIVSIDLPGGLFGGGYTEMKERVYSHFAVSPQRIHFLRANSHAQSTHAALVELLSGKPIDVLFLDGDHSYEGVKCDFEMYAPLVRPGGLVGLHDMVAHGIDGCDVDRFWDEIRDRYEHKEFIGEPPAGWGGIGVVRIPG